MIQKTSDNKLMKSKPPKVLKKAGRPKANIDLTQYKALMRLNPTLKDTAAFFDVCEDTIIDWLERELGTRDFSGIRDKNLVHTRLMLIRTAVRQAENGNNTMLIFCLKNLCGWVDRVEHGFDKDKKTILLKYNLEDESTDANEKTVTEIDTKDR